MLVSLILYKYSALCVYLLKMHLTAHSGPVILLQSFYATRISPPKGGINDTGSMILVTETSDQTRQRGHTLSLYSTHLILGRLALPSLPPCHSLDILLSTSTEPTLSCQRVSLLPSKSCPFSASCLQLLRDFLRFFTPPPPSPVLSLAAGL